MRTAALTSLALVAFAANSIFCRAALGARQIDAASFTSVRLLAGAATLALLLRLLHPAPERPGGSWASAALLFLYAISFSFAYNTLSTGTGALILFAAVQATMLAAAVRAGERPRPRQWLGLATALGGLVYLVLPGLAAPDPAGALLMTTAGAAWGLYTLRGRTAGRPLAETAGNFLRSVPLVLLVTLFSLADLRLTLAGAALAAASGALASGVGYAIWYTALGGLTATVAATVQLSVPVLAAVGGIALLGEQLTPRLAVASLLILGGIALTLRRPTAATPGPDSH